MNHLTGHDHHHAPGELSSCEKRRASTETSFWPPMDCFRLSIVAEKTDLPQKDSFNMVSHVLAFFLRLDVDQFESIDAPFLKLPDPLANSDPPRQTKLQRGPPLV